MLNPAGALGVAYALLCIVVVSRLSVSVLQNNWRYGTILLLVSYGLLAYFYFKRFLEIPSQPWNNRKITFGVLSQLGFGGLSVFLALNLVGLLGIASKYYDIFGAIGYGFFAFAMPVGVYFVMAYLALTMAYHWRMTSAMDILQMVGRGIILAFYVSLMFPH